VVPQFTAVFGTCGGGSAVSAALSDFTFMPKSNAKLFVNSPNALEGNYTAKCDTASAEYQAAAGVVDVVMEDEAAVLAGIRTLVSVLPANNEAEAVVDCFDDLNRAVSFDTLSADPAKALADISDNNFYTFIRTIQ
jgi:acetyl-CoA carboxylase carboxyltransferase component